MHVSSQTKGIIPFSTKSMAKLHWISIAMNYGQREKKKRLFVIVIDLVCSDKVATRREGVHPNCLLSLAIARFNCDYPSAANIFLSPAGTLCYAC